MTATINILATVRNPALLDAALLVFKTLRTGFPTWPVRVFGNGLTGDALDQMANAATSNGCEFVWIPQTTHDAWIETLIETQGQPFGICDTDMIFWHNMESLLSVPEHFSGRFEPGFNEEWTGCWHVERLHTCLMLLNPQTIRAWTRHWMTQHVPSVFPAAETQFIRQHFVPQRGGKPLFYDSTAGLWQAGIGTPFTPEQDAGFEHLHCGTYADVIGKHLSVDNFAANQRAICANPELARGLKHQQDFYYQEQGNGPRWWQSVTRQKDNNYALSE